tara:strand:+ start:8006 stop:8578 length:573 start_codon:yes stop_codon:yes gene_type:complete
MGVEIRNTVIQSVLIITPKRIRDRRGFFEETWNNNSLADNGINIHFVQDNHSYSKDVGTLRGLHYQSPPFAQDKLVRCIRGAIFDVAVDIRKGSPTYGKWIGAELTSDNGQQLLIPAGFLHGFLTLKDDTEVQYKCSNYYSPECDGTIHWSSCDISWPIPVGIAPLLSEKDSKAQHFKKLESPFVWDGKY